jgi:hypothetical protein
MVLSEMAWSSVDFPGAVPSDQAVLGAEHQLERGVGQQFLSPAVQLHVGDLYVHVGVGPLIGVWSGSEKKPEFLRGEPPSVGFP